ncbi:4'-phosphopantetheinyl transferase superfamily protein [Flavobacterium sp.]|uniref:4'-phosphopantetheinyl transferase family protein n=1 Tax=Flavobacterium sp. TaxID=239 RepID=UPI0035AE1AA7
MPFFKSIKIKPNTNLYLWKITESYDWFCENVKLKEISFLRLESMKSESHRKGFLAVRMLLQEIGYSDYDLFYDDFGKPHLQDGKHISISHSNDFSAVVISNEILGLDIEQLKEKTLKIAPRFMQIHHLEGLSFEEKLKKSTVVWGIKEAIFKIKNEKGISFPEHIFEKPFDLNDKKATGILQFNGKEEFFNAHFDQIENYIFVCVFEERNE